MNTTHTTTEKKKHAAAAAIVHPDEHLNVQHAREALVAAKSALEQAEQRKADADVAHLRAVEAEDIDAVTRAASAQVIAHSALRRATDAHAKSTEELERVLTEARTEHFLRTFAPRGARPETLAALLEPHVEGAAAGVGAIVSAVERMSAIVSEATKADREARALGYPTTTVTPPPDAHLRALAAHLQTNRDELAQAVEAHMLLSKLLELVKVRPQ